MTEKSESIEIHPMRGHSRGEWYGTLDDAVDSDEEAEYWALFGVTHRGNKHCLGEFPTKSAAMYATQCFRLPEKVRMSRIHPQHDVRIVPLADTVEAIPTIARWFLEEWEPYYGPGGPGDATKELEECCNRNNIPMALVALDDSGAVLGTAALKAESVGAELGLGPWLAALYVPTEHRKRGVATTLVEAIENEAGRLGFETIYTSTDSADDVVKRRGWTVMEENAMSLRGQVSIYRQRLGGIR